MCLSYLPSRMSQPPLCCFPGGTGSTEPAVQETRESGVQSQGQEDPLQEGMATHSTVLAWRIPRTEEPCGLRSTGSQRDTCDWSSLACVHTPTFAFASWALINNKRKRSQRVWSKYHRESQMSEGSGEWLEPQGRCHFPRGAEQVGSRSWHRGWERPLSPPGAFIGEGRFHPPIPRSGAGWVQELAPGLREAPQSSWLLYGGGKSLSTNPRERNRSGPGAGTGAERGPSALLAPAMGNDALSTGPLPCSASLRHSPCWGSQYC